MPASRRGLVLTTSFESAAGVADQARHYRGAPHAAGRRAGILLDRDGTIIADHGYVASIERVELLDGAAEAIARFNRAGIPVAVLTNQAGVARGFFGTEDVERVHRYLAEKLAEHEAHIDLFLYCPYHPEGTVRRLARVSSDRKPAPGMAIKAAKALNLDLSRSWVVGDREEDVGLARAVDARAVFVGPPAEAPAGAVPFPDLAAAASFILAGVAG